MFVIDQLSTSLNRRDQVPNQELAERIVDSKDKKAVKVLVDHLKDKNKGIQNDCIKVLYEIGERDSKLISKYVNEFLELLDSKNNRLQWGGLTALNTVTLEKPKAIYAALNQIIETADKGSVITKDHAVGILIKLCSLKPYADGAFTLLIEQLVKSPTNQLPMYAERAMPIIHEKNKMLFIETLSARLNDIEKETKRKRVEKVIKKISMP